MLVSVCGAHDSPHQTAAATILLRPAVRSPHGLSTDDHCREDRGQPTAATRRSGSTHVRCTRCSPRSAAPLSGSAQARPAKRVSESRSGLSPVWPGVGEGEGARCWTALRPDARMRAIIPCFVRQGRQVQRERVNFTVQTCHRPRAMQHHRERRACTLVLTRVRLGDRAPLGPRYRHPFAAGAWGIAADWARDSHTSCSHGEARAGRFVRTAGYSRLRWEPTRNAWDRCPRRIERRRAVRYRRVKAESAAIGEQPTSYDP